MEDQRVALSGLQRPHFAGDDHVVAGGEDVAEVAGDEDQGVVDGGDAVAVAPADAAPLLGDGGLGGEGAGDRLLAGVEDADAEAVGGLDGEQGAGAAVEAGEHHHRLDRERGDGVGGRPGRAIRPRGGDDRDPGREPCHGGSEAGWIGRRHRQESGIGVVAGVGSRVPHLASDSSLAARTQDAAFAGGKGKSEDAAAGDEAPPGRGRTADPGH